MWFTKAAKPSLFFFPQKRHALFRCWSKKTHWRETELWRSLTSSEDYGMKQLLLRQGVYSPIEKYFVGHNTRATKTNSQEETTYPRLVLWSVFSVKTRCSSGGVTERTWWEHSASIRSQSIINGHVNILWGRAMEKMSQGHTQETTAQTL